LISRALITGAFEAPYQRHPPPSRSTAVLLAEAVSGLLANTGVRPEEVDGFGVASFSLKPDHAIDLAWRLGLRVRWLMEDPHGGASALNLVQHALRAVDAGDASTIVLCSGDHLDRTAFAGLVANYNGATAAYLAPLGSSGPNALFAMLTTRYLGAHGLGRDQLAAIPVAQRAWATMNPGAVYRTPLSVDEYLAAPFVASPLCRFDCVPVVAGADAVLIQAEDIAGRPAIAVRAVGGLHNPDDQQGDALTSGLAELMPRLWREAAVHADDIDAAFLYDDYPVMVAIQAADAGLIADGDLARWLRVTLGEQHWPLNTSGGQLSAGQAGAAGGMHGLVEAVTQLQGRGGARSAHARLALVSGYGMVLYRHGASHTAAVLEALR
jgi:acetyl-CoA acetyltransferase